MAYWIVWTPAHTLSQFADMFFFSYKIKLHQKNCISAFSSFMFLIWNSCPTVDPILVYLYWYCLFQAHKETGSHPELASSQFLDTIHSHAHSCMKRTHIDTRSTRKQHRVYQELNETSVVIWAVICNCMLDSHVSTRRDFSAYKKMHFDQRKEGQSKSSSITM